MQTKDITTRTELKSKGKLAEALKVLAAFLEGHIITIGGEDYRYAQKDDHLYEDDKQIYVATESGFSQRFNSFSGGEKTPSSFRWILVADSLAFFMRLFDGMTEDEVTIALSNRSLTDINVRGSRSGRINSQRENRSNEPRTMR